MRKIQYPPVYAGTFFLLLISVLSVVNYDALIGEVFFNVFFYPLLFGAGLAAGASYRKSESVTIKTIGTLVVLSAFPVFIAMNYFHGLERAAVVLLIWLQAGRNFTLHTRRDLFYAYVVSLILILYGASVSKEGTFLIYIVTYALSGMLTLMADHIDERLHKARGGDKYLLVRGLNLPSKGVGLAALTLVLASVIYLLFPRLPSPHLQGLPFGKGWFYENKEWDSEAERLKRSDREENGASEAGVRDLNSESDAGSGGRGGGLWDKGKTSAETTSEYPGFRKSFNIRECRKTLSRALLFYLQSDRPLYVRGKVFEEFDGRIWHEARDEGELVFAERSEFVLRKEYRGESVGQVYTIKRKMPPIILSAYQPVTIRFPSNLIRKTPALSLYAPDNLREGTSYSVLSAMEKAEGRETCGGEPYEGGYLQVPEVLSERVRRLAAQVTEGKGDDFRKAEAVESFLRHNYRYTMETVFRERPDDLVDDFLFGLEEGHCEYFASAMVIMLRSVGIPSRLVTGYLAFSRNPFTGYYEVRASHAHAWVEAYSDRYGWVRFEPTPKIRRPDESRELFAIASYARYLQEQIDAALRSSRNKWWKSFLNALNEALLRAKLFSSLLASSVVLVFRWFLSKGWRFFLSGIILVLAGLALRRLLLPLIRQMRLRMIKGKDPRLFVIACYCEMAGHFADRGVPRPPAMSHAEYRNLLRGKFTHLTEEIGRITNLFEKARYSPFPIEANDSEEAYRMYRAVRMHGARSSMEEE